MAGIAMVREAGVWKRDLWGKSQVELMEHTSVGVGCGSSVLWLALVTVWYDPQSNSKNVLFSAVREHTRRRQ